MHMDGVNHMYAFYDMQDYAYTHDDISNSYWKHAYDYIYVDAMHVDVVCELFHNYHQFDSMVS